MHAAQPHPTGTPASPSHAAALAAPAVACLAPPPSQNKTNQKAELRRHKRAFLKLATKVTFSRLQDPAAAQRLFVDHLRMTLAGSASS